MSYVRWSPDLSNFYIYDDIAGGITVWINSYPTTYFNSESRQEVIDFIETNIEKGYIIPKYVITQLRQDILDFGDYVD